MQLAEPQPHSRVAGWDTPTMSLMTLIGSCSVAIHRPSALDLVWIIPLEMHLVSCPFIYLHFTLILLSLFLIKILYVSSNLEHFQLAQAPNG